MPKSRIRKKDDFTPPPAKQATNIKLTSRSWVAPLMLAMFLIGLAWIVVFYVTEGDCRSTATGQLEHRGRLRLHRGGLRRLHAVEVASKPCRAIH